ncbi:branched-chain amino acid ABC transporter permease [Verrucosispora sp. WMMC514]|uniref:branched-chain amino acid ABC transporter permease n=1 Tax=Verrucosispora sp. WMMC514 TaxID=3015156 RepID=UPI00248A9302|nr:branched-chain amino acid ABC transporter permease [Verrucosispora sp. WMMC514]WBB89880.1 branched-chain amino acid ABC transporter permease [Verrucosispora sp. WMMC514]
MSAFPIVVSPRRARHVTRAAVSVVLLVALAIPFFMTAFSVFQVSLILALAIGVLGLNLLVGYGGQVSLGHSFFIAVGGYTSAVLMADHGWNFFATLIPVALFSGGAGLLLGFPALRLRGLYLALATLALALSTGPLLRRFEGLTGGVQGVIVPTPDWLRDSPLGKDASVYYIVLAAMLLVTWLVSRITSGYSGLALAVIKQNEIVARSQGVDTARWKTALFGTSGMLAGLGGAFYVLAIGFIAPQSVGVMLSIFLLAGVVMGGLGSVWGALFGAAIVHLLPQYAADVNQGLSGMVFGVAIIAVMFLMPGGFVQLFRTALGKLVQVRDEARSAEEEMGNAGNLADARSG